MDTLGEALRSSEPGAGISADACWEMRVRALCRAVGVRAEHMAGYACAARHALDERGLKAAPENAGIVLDCLCELGPSPLGRFDGTSSLEDVYTAVVDLLIYHGMVQALAALRQVGQALRDGTYQAQGWDAQRFARMLVDMVQGRDGSRVALLATSIDSEVFAIAVVAACEWDDVRRHLPQITGGSWWTVTGEKADAHRPSTKPPRAAPGAARARIVGILVPVLVVMLLGLVRCAQGRARQIAAEREEARKEARQTQELYEYDPDEFENMQQQFDDIEQKLK